MKSLNSKQRQFLADFFNSSSVAWLTAGFIAQYFVQSPLIEKIGGAAIATLFATICLLVGLNLLRRS